MPSPPKQSNFLILFLGFDFHRRVFNLEGVFVDEDTIFPVLKIMLLDCRIFLLLILLQTHQHNTKCIRKTSHYFIISRQRTRSLHRIYQTESVSEIDRERDFHYSIKKILFNLFLMLNDAILLFKL